jgi:hypothetical protein
MYLIHPKKIKTDLYVKGMDEHSGGLFVAYTKKG